MKILRTGLVLFLVAFFIALFNKNNIEHTSLFDIIVETLHNKIDRKQYEVLDDSFLQPHFTPLSLQRAKELLDSNKTKLPISMVLRQKTLNKKSHKLKLLVHTNRHNPYFKDKVFFQISSDAITFETCRRYKKDLMDASITTINLYIKNDLYTKKIVLNKKICNTLDTSFLDNINKQYDITLNPFIPKINIHKKRKIKSTKNSISKDIFQSRNVVYTKSHFTILKDSDDKAFIVKDKKLLKVINLHIKYKDYKANFLIDGTTLYYTDVKLHKLNLKTLKVQIAPYYAPYFHTIYMDEKNIYATFTKGDKNYALLNDINYLVIYNKNLQLKKFYSCNRSLKESFYNKNLFVNYDGKLYEFDRNLKLLTIHKNMAKIQAKEKYKY